MSADAMTTGSRTRRRIATAVVAAATVSGLAATAVPAFADDASPLGIGRAVTDSAQHGSFTVPAWSDDAADALASVTAVIRDGGTPVGDPIALVRQDTAGSGADTWTLPADGVLKLTEDGGRMPHLGDYAIDVTATDAHGGTLTRTDAGTLDFTMVPRFRQPPVSDPAAVDFTHPDLTVSGTLVGVRPGSGNEVPLAGRDLSVGLVSPNSYGLGTLPAVTAADGHWSAVAHLDTSTYFQPEFTENSAEVHGTVTASVRPDYHWTSASLTATADHSRVLPGKTFQVSGVVRQGQDASSPAAGGARVTVALDCPYSPAGTDPAHVPTATADAAGRYSVTVTADPECYGTWTASADGLALSTQAYVYGRVAFPDTAMFSGVSSSIAADGWVTATGHLLRTYHRNSAYQGQNTALWYSHNGKTGWTRLRAGSSDGNGAFRLTVYGYVDGYYQVRHTDTDELAASNGPVVRLHRTDTRMVSLRANHTRVRKNTVITVSGTLQQSAPGAWRAYGHRHVELYFRPRTSKTWQYKGSGTTATNGTVSFRPKVTGDGYWLIQYFGDSTHFDSGGKAVYVDMI